MRLRRIILCVLASGFLLRAQLAAPKAGWTVDARQIARPVLGFGGNYWLGPGGVTGVISAAFSNAGGILKTKSSVLVLDTSGRVVLKQSAPGGAAIFGFSSQGKIALAYYPSNRQLFRYDGSGFAPVPASAADGEVLSITEPDALHALLITNGQGTLRSMEIRIADGAISSSEPLPGVSEPVLAQPGGSIVFQRSGALVARSKSGVESITPVEFIPGSFATMGNGWTQVNEKNGPRRFAWNPAPGHERIFQLPGEAR